MQYAAVPSIPLRLITLLIERRASIIITLVDSVSVWRNIDVNIDELCSMCPVTTGFICKEEIWEGIGRGNHFTVFCINEKVQTTTKRISCNAICSVLCVSWIRIQYMNEINH